MIKVNNNIESTLLREVSTWSVEDVSDYVFYLVYIWVIPIHYKYIVYLLQQCLCNKFSGNNNANGSTKTSNSVTDRNQKQKHSEEEEDVAIVEVIDETQNENEELTNNVNNSDNRMQRWSDCINCTSSLEEMEQFVRTDLFNSIVERGEEANNKISECKTLIKHCYNNNNSSIYDGELTHSHIVLLSLVSNCCKEQNVAMSEVNASIGFNVKIMENKCAESNNEQMQRCKAEVIALHSTFMENSDNNIMINNWAEATYWTAVADVYNLEKEQTNKSHSIDSLTTLPRLKFNPTMEKKVKPKGKNTKRTRESVNNTKEQNNNKRSATQIHKKNNKNTLNFFSRAHSSDHHHSSTALPALSPITLITQGDSQNSTMNDVHIIIEEEEEQSASHSSPVNESNDVIVISDDDDDDDSTSHHVEQTLQSVKHLSIIP